GRSQGAGLGNAALRAVGGGGKWRAGQSKARCVNWRSPTSFPVRGGMRGAPRRDSHRRKFARLSAFEPSVPLRKRRPWREAPRRTIIVSRGDLCLMTPSSLSVRHLPSATAERPFARAGPMVRIRFPPAESQVRTCLSREFAFLGREAAVFRGCPGRDDRPGSAETRGRGNIWPKGGDISVGPYSSTAPPVMKSATMPRILSRVRSRRDVGEQP